MKLIVMLTNHRNLDQTSAMIADQIVLNTAKQVQWQCTERFDQLLFMLGTLHIGMVFMSAIEDWVAGSRWIDIFNKEKLTVE